MSQKLIHGTYQAIIHGYDWGCGVEGLIITLDSPIDKVNKEYIKVEETKQNTDWTSPAFDIVVQTTSRTVLDAFLCDKKGHPTTLPSYYVYIQLGVSPAEGSPLLFSMHSQFNTYSHPYDLDITISNTTCKNEDAVIEIEKEMTSKITDADEFELSTYIASDGITYSYAAYEAKEPTDTLVVWLHGLGEGGSKDTDPYITCLANKVTALIQEPFQNTINHAHVLVPQCPTFWMDKDGKGDINGGQIIADGTSYYTKSLHELIDYYKEKCGAKRVFIMGCSNGGYMTLLMAIQYRNEYQAYIPICEAIPAKCITEEQLEGIKDLPLYFIYSNDDPVVDPTLHEIPTIERLQKYEPANLHTSTFEHVVDTTGQYLDPKGNPYQYSGHWSWIYFFNNEANSDQTSIPVWDWLKELL